MPASPIVLYDTAGAPPGGLEKLARCGHVSGRRDALLILFDHVWMLLTSRIRLSQYLLYCPVLEFLLCRSGRFLFTYGFLFADRHASPSVEGNCRRALFSDFSGCSVINRSIVFRHETGVDGCRKLLFQCGVGRIKRT